MENGSWVPWIVLNVHELIDQLNHRGFDKFFIITSYKRFAGNGERYLPKEFYEPGFGSARTAILAIKKDGMNQALNVDGSFTEDVTLIESNDRISIPLMSEC
jgi:hypothetical protein